MKYAVSSREMKIYDRNTSDVFGIPSQVLMERASLKVADVIDERIKARDCKRKYRALVMAGVGNNGGDGAAIARLLKQRGYLVSLCVIGDLTKCSDLLLSQLKICEKYGIDTATFSNIRDNKSIFEWDIIVDALFGIGLSRIVTGSFLDAIDYISRCKEEKKDDLLVVSVDMPSGINADNGEILGAAVRADVTVTFNQIKLGQILYPGCEYVGELVVEDAGITQESFCGRPPRAFFYDETPEMLLPARRKDSNKGTNGKVLIIAGSDVISGACSLATLGCIKAGAGMVKVFTRSSNANIIKTTIPEALIDTYDELSEIKDKLMIDFKWADAVVLGPGIGTDDVAFELVNITLDACDKHLVLDADALNLIAQRDDLRIKVSNYAVSGRKLILTPHLAEFARLFKKTTKECKDAILEYPKTLADELHCTVICKDARSVVSDSNEKKIYINVSGNDGMATAGSGDVLAGLLGAVCCSMDTGFETACIGAYIHGLSGDSAARKHGKYAMVASDIATELEDILR